MKTKTLPAFMLVEVAEHSRGVGRGTILVLANDPLSFPSTLSPSDTGIGDTVTFRLDGLTENPVWMSTANTLAWFVKDVGGR